MSASKRRALGRRLAHIEARIAAKQGSPSALSYDRAEASALRWVLRALMKPPRVEGKG